jgi:hypothetical protein
VRVFQVPPVVAALAHDGDMDSNDDHLHGSAGMGKIGRSYSRFDEPLVEHREDPTSAPQDVAVGLVALFVALGLVGLLLTFWPG